mgnify:CR=1 FL=1
MEIRRIPSQCARIVGGRGLGALAFAAAALFAIPGSGLAQESTVSRTEVQDSFFNTCTEEVVDRTYTRHITNRNPPGSDARINLNWSNGKGVGQKTGNAYTMTYRIQQMTQDAESDDNGQQMFNYRIRTTVTSQGSASDYTSNIKIRLRMNADGTVQVDESEATGIQCS